MNRRGRKVAIFVTILGIATIVGGLLQGAFLARA